MKKSTVTVSMRWPKFVKQAMERLAKEERRNLTQQVLLAVQEHLAEQPRPHRAPRKPWFSVHPKGKPSHVYPLDDLKEHVTRGARCWCKPKTEYGIIVHNSADGRERYENGERKTS